MRNTAQRFLESLLQDLRFAARLMRRDRGFTAIAVLTLGLGIGANTAVYSLLDAVVLHPLPYPEPERLQILLTVEGKSQRAMMGNSYLNFRDCEAQARSFERMTAFSWHSFNLTGAGDPVSVSALATSGGLFDVFGMPPSRGRAVRDNEEEPVAVISHNLWVGRFAGDPAILGRTILLDGRPFIIVGVAPRAFHFEPRRDAEPDLFVRLEPDRDRGRFDVRIVGRLRRGVSPAQAQAELNAIARRLAERNPEVDRRQGILVEPLLEHVVRNTGRTTALLVGAVAFLLLVACVNVANLLLSRGIVRDREIAIRLAIGASRARVVRQMLTESSLLSLLGGGVGLAFAYLALPFLAAIAPEHTPFFTRIQDNGIRVNTAVLAFTSAVSLAAAVVVGLLPALRATRPIRSSGGAAPATPSPHGNARAAGVLVAVEIALSFVLVAGAGLMLGTLWRLLSVEVGFRTSNLLTLSVRPPDTKYPDARSQSEYLSRVLVRLRALPGVQSAAAVSTPPMRRENWNSPFRLEGSDTHGQASFHVVSPSYFETMGIPVLQGRPFRDSDGAGVTAVAMISRRMAERYWPGESAVGKGIVITQLVLAPAAKGSGFATTPVRADIIGVVGNVRQLGLDDDPRVEMFVPMAQGGAGNIWNETTFVLRSEGGATGVLARRAIDAVHTVDRDQPVTDVKTMDELIGEDTASPRFVLVLLGLFALIALSLAAFGIYAVVAHAVARRTPEIAVRLALGGRPGEVVTLIVRQHFVWVLGGIAAGVAGALGVARLLASHLFGVTATDAPTYACAAVVLAVIALAADLIPALRAARVTPAAILRAE